MAGGVNKVILIGNLGKDPEVRFTPSGMPVANFTIASFTGWGNCGAGAAESVRIAVGAAEWPRSMYGIDAKAAAGPSMWLNFTFTGLPAVSWGLCQTNESERLRCIRNIAVHEFGHSLGFMHEQARRDTPTWCAGETQAYPGDTVGPWDLDSVMNYCNSRWTGDGKLSNADIQGAQQTYGYVEYPDAFDTDFYLRVNPDLLAAFGSDEGQARQHWLSYGRMEGRFGAPGLNPAFYLSKSSALKTAYGATNFLAAIDHFQDSGLKAGRRGSVLYWGDYYLGRYADVRSKFGSNKAAAYRYWLSTGLGAGHRASPEFDPGYYLNQNPDLQAAFKKDYRAAMIHWIVYGIREGRRGAPAD